MKAKPAVALLLLALIGLIAACGDDEPETTTVTDTTTETTTTTTTTTTTEQAGGDGGGGGGGGTTRDCGDVAFQPNSDAGAFDIQATGVGCGSARAVAGAAEGQQGSDYSARGFSCTGQAEGGPLPATSYTCTSDGATITFSAS